VGCDPLAAICAQRLCGARLTVPACPSIPCLAPQLGYCQGLNYVAALLLLASGRDTERAFWLLAAMVGQVLAANTYASNLAGCHSEMRTLGVLVEKKVPRLHK